MTNNKLLSKKFFQDNPLDVVSAPAIAHFNIKVSPEPLNDTISKISLKFISKKRKKEIEEEAKIISETSSSDQMLKLLRKKIDPINNALLIQKALDFESEIISSVIELYKTTGNDNFVENSIRFLSRCKCKPSKKLIDFYDMINNKYAQSMLFVVLSFNANKSDIPWIYEKYFELKKFDTKEEKFSQGALLALYDLADECDFN